MNQFGIVAAVLKEYRMSHLHMDHFTIENFGQVLFTYNKVTGGHSPNPIDNQKFQSIRKELLENGCSWRKYGSSLSPQGNLMMKVSGAGLVAFSFIPDLPKGAASAKNKKDTDEMAKNFSEKMQTQFTEEVKKPKSVRQ